VNRCTSCCVYVCEEALQLPSYLGRELGDVSNVWVKLIRLTNSHSMPKEYSWVIFIPYCVGWSGHFQRVAKKGLGTRLSSTCEKVGIKWNTNESSSTCSSYLSMLRNITFSSTQGCPPFRKVLVLTLFDLLWSSWMFGHGSPVLKFFQ